MSAAWYPKFARVNSRRPPIGPATAITSVGAMANDVNASRNGSRCPPRSDSAPRIGDTIALMPTLTATDTLKASWPTAGPNWSGRMSHRPMAYERTANEKIVLAKSYSAQAAFADVLRFGSLAGVGSGSVGIAGAVGADIRRLLGDRDSDHPACADHRTARGRRRSARRGRGVPSGSIRPWPQTPTRVRSPRRGSPN